VKRVLIVTDTFHGSTNGVAKTLDYTTRELNSRGYVAKVISPNTFRSVHCPYSQDAVLAWDLWHFPPLVEEFKPEFLHIATEGPLGLAARHYAHRRGWRYSTSYHTKFPEFIGKMVGGWARRPVYWYVRWFHRNSRSILVTTQSMADLLAEAGFRKLTVWSRGVDTEAFNPHVSPHPLMADLPRPILLNVGRVSIEKSLPDFYKLTTPGTKVQVGNGPLLEEYKRAYPEVVFLGEIAHGPELAQAYRAADVMVFPSREDTFGLVNIESMACGTPVAAYEVPGPIDIIHDGQNGFCHPVLSYAVPAALEIKDRDGVSRYTCDRFSWKACTDTFVEHLVPVQ
jgi:glycosyltransferase involved in cell wall biosynthesis